MNYKALFAAASTLLVLVNQSVAQAETEASFRGACNPRNIRCEDDGTYGTSDPFPFHPVAVRQTKKTYGERSRRAKKGGYTPPTRVGRTDSEHRFASR